MKFKIGMLLLLLCSEKILYALGGATKDHSITIFVHGTYLMRKVWQYSPSRSLMYCPQGLTLAKNLPTHYFFYRMARGFIGCDSENYSLEQFYIFGWPSEHVNDKTRNEAAKILVEQIYEVIIDYYVKHDVVPKIRLIGFSHGGNVILHCANYIPEYADMQEIEFEAWLFGTPVQVISHDLVNSDCFKAVYSMYSKKDIVQKIDPQGMINWKMTKNHFWSDRTFCPYSRCIQVELTVNGESFGHSYYNNIFQFFPKIKKIVEAQSTHLECGGMIAVDFKM